MSVLSACRSWEVGTYARTDMNGSTRNLVAEESSGSVDSTSSDAK